MRKEEREGRLERGVLRSGHQAKKGGAERRGGEGVFMVPTQGSKIPLDLN